MIQEGDLVEVLDDTLVGTVIQILDDKIIIDSDGFTLSFLPDQLVKVSQRPLDISLSNLGPYEEKKLSKRYTTPRAAKKQRKIPPMEVDLHIEKLVGSTKGMDNHAMLDLQLETAKRQLEFAIRKRIQRMVFIHGVGEGVLKQELIYLFKRYENIRFYDADYQKYGLGATEVSIAQKAKLR